MTACAHHTVPTRFLPANGIHPAYRRFGGTAGVFE